MQLTISDCSDQVAEYVGFGAREADGELATTQHVYLLVRGMGCPTCALRVRTALLAVQGVHSAEVLLDKGVALVYYEAECVNFDDLTTAVMRADQSGRHHYSAKILDGWV